MAFWVNEKGEGKTWLLDPRQPLRVKVFPYVEWCIWSTTSQESMCLLLNVLLYSSVFTKP